MKIRGWAVVAALALTAMALAACAAQEDSGPWDSIPSARAHVDHGSFFTAHEFTDGPSVTRACLQCHEQEAHDFMATSHWTWRGDTVEAADGSRVQIGKANLINNFCIGIQSNEARCTSCHAGYGWRDNDFDFSDATRIDCLVCHDNTGSYRKATAGAGHPEESVDLMAVARSVGPPTRQNCGYCHFRGGGGDAVKHGDLDGSMYFPTERIDVHMGRHDFNCTDCHQAQDHEMPGRSMSVSVSAENRLYCTRCHDPEPHESTRLNAHGERLACGSCHIPYYAIDAPTKMEWDWSQAGEDRAEPDPHIYNKKKGSFVYGQKVEPEYYWYDGESDRYLAGEEIDPAEITRLNWPHGSRDGEGSKIWPFKVHRGKQIYDVASRSFVVPNTYGEGGYWENYDWDQALRQGSAGSGLPYSGEFAFAATEMYWPLAHMVARSEQALSCNECHAPAGEQGRMDWAALGYDEDPLLGEKATRWSDHPEMESKDPTRAEASCVECHDTEEMLAVAAHPSLEECALCHLQVTDEAGEPVLTVQRAPDSACASCHGGVLAHSQPISPGDLDGGDEFVVRGELFSSQRLMDSGLNLQGKAELGRPFDLHAARGIGCADCHDVHAAGSHGRAVATKRCVDCHEALTGHDWLPAKSAHLEAVACTACHVGSSYLPAPVELASGGEADGATGQEPVEGVISGRRPQIGEMLGLDGKKRRAAFRQIDGEPIFLHHGLVTGRYALRDCDTCHEDRRAEPGPAVVREDPASSASPASRSRASSGGE